MSILKTIGNTPIIELYNIIPDLKIYAKNEAINPGGSIKDRAAYYMIMDALESGDLKKDMIIVEATSGNTGISLALIASVLNLKLIVCMPDSMTKERIKAITSYGANVILTPGIDGMSGAIKKSNEILKNKKGWSSFQFNNPSNVKAHYETSGPEIWKQMEGNIDYFISGVGTGGTIMGIGKYLKEKNSNIKIVAVEPEKSPVLSMGKSYANLHRIQGIGADFIPKIVNKKLFDFIIQVSDSESVSMARELAKKCGVKSGFSTGANIVAAKKIADKNPEARIVTIICDTGDRYYSTDLY